MAEFAFKATWNDSLNVLRNLLAHPEYVLIPDLAYDDPESLKQHENGDVEQLVLSGQVFIRSEQFSHLPTCFLQVEKGKHAGKYFVTATTGGPLLTLLIPFFYEIHPTLGPISLHSSLGETLRPHLGKGALWYHSKTYDPQAEEYIKPSPELIEGFRDVRRILKEKLVKRNQEFVGPEAKELLDKGQAVAD